MQKSLTYFDRQHVLDALTFLHGNEGPLIELRHKRGDGMIGHYSTDRDHLAKVAESQNGCVNVYVTLNPIVPGLAERGDNSIKTTKSRDVASRRWLLLNFNPSQAKETISTGDQFELSRRRAEDCAGGLSVMGWPEPTVACSVDGTQLLYAVNSDNNPENDQLFRSLTEAIALKWGDDIIGVDRTGHKAGCVVELYGTGSVKPAEDGAGHTGRYAQLLSTHPRVLVTENQMREVIGAWQEPKRGPGRPKKRDFEALAAKCGKPFDMAGWLRQHKIGVQSVEKEADHVKYALDHCPFNPDDRGGNAAVFMYGDGTREFRCSHEFCQEKNWQALRTKFDPAFEKRQMVESELAKLDLIVTAGKPLLQINNCDYHDLTLNALKIIAGHNDPPTIFQQAGKLMIITKDAADPKLVALGLEKMRQEINKRVTCINTNQSESGETFKKTNAPSTLAHALLVLGQWDGIPVCDAVVQVPVIATDGTIHSTAGYNAVTRSYLTTDEFAFNRNPRTITREQAIAARDWLLDGPFEGFPFVDAASRANALGAMLQQPLCRVIADNTPMFLLDASRPGSGKGLLAEVIAYSAGKKNITLPLPQREEEIQKTIISTLSARPAHVLLDNVKGMVNSPSLEALLTARVFSSRLLGVSENVNLCNTQTCWMLAANNATFSTDLTTRSCYIRLEPNVADPTQRTDFKISDLPEWLAEHRIEVFHRVLTILAYWIAQGMPKYSGNRRHRLNRWRLVIGGVLEKIGLGDDFLANSNALNDAADPETPAWGDFVKNWLAQYGTKTVVAKDLLDAAFGDIIDPARMTRREGPLDAVLGVVSEDKRNQRLGIAIRGKVGAIYEGHRITVVKSDSHGNRFRLLPIAGAPPRETQGSHAGRISEPTLALASVPT